MDQGTFVFDRRGHCLKDKECQPNTLKDMCLCSNHTSLFSLYAVPSCFKPKGTLVH